MNKNISFDLPNEAETLNFGAKLAKTLQPGIVIYLEGDLGTGKTTLVRGLLRQLGYPGIVKSPTYTLLETYTVANFKICHWDLYRIQVPEELDYIGQGDFFDGTMINLIEWPKQGSGHIQQADVVCALQFEQEGRRVTAMAQTKQGGRMVKLLGKNPP